MGTPKRIQRKRTKGWRMPEVAVYVGRPTRWGNPFPILSEVRGAALTSLRRRATEAFAAYVIEAPWAPEFAEAVRTELRGKDLACWCPLDQPCHADVLLQIANEGEPA